MAKKAAEINPKSAVRLKELLDAEQITAKELARRADVTPNTISKIMQGKTPLSYTVAQGIEQAFPGVRAAYLMGLDDLKTTTEETLYPVAKQLVSDRSRRKAVDNLLGSLGYGILPNDEAHPVFPEVGTLDWDKMGAEKYRDLIHRLYSASTSPDAYIITRDGEPAGYCNEARRKSLYSEILDYADYLISKICKKEESDNGKPD